jgi:hypothetical protein
MLMLRLKVKDGEITEIETIKCNKGEADQLWGADNLREVSPALPLTLPFEMYAVCSPIVRFAGEPMFSGRYSEIAKSENGARLGSTGSLRKMAPGGTTNDALPLKFNTRSVPGTMAPLPL